MDLPVLVRGIGAVLVGMMVAVVVIQAEGYTEWHYKDTGGADIHGGVQMGVSDDECDNGRDNLTVDWNNDKEDYLCMGKTYRSNSLRTANIPEARCRNYDLDPPLHKCMSEPILYDGDPIPVAGAHRPLWAKFGEYRYLPKQRWLHNLEHGCAVFLYHPCADPDEVNVLRQIARACLRKHIITPLKELSRETPFAVLTYGCKLLLPYVDVERVVEFLRKHALDAPEKEVVQNGQFDVELEVPADIVSDLEDSEICPTSKEIQNEDEDRSEEELRELLIRDWLQWNY